MPGDVQLLCHHDEPHPVADPITGYLGSDPVAHPVAHSVPQPITHPVAYHFKAHICAKPVAHHFESHACAHTPQLPWRS